jgi:elongation factor Ts
MINVEIIKKLREETGAGVLEIKLALEKFEDDYEKVKADLLSKGASKAAKKADRVTKDGLVHAYIHGTGKVGSMVAVACETDFVAKTDAFIKLCHEIAMQICTEEYADVEAVLNAEYMRDPSKKVQDLINDTIAKLGEKIELKKFVRFAVSE